MKRKIKYKEGDVFSVPLRDGGFARGVIVRHNGSGEVYGKFYGPRHVNFQNSSSRELITVDNYIFHGQFGDLGLLNGSWKIVSSIEPWSRAVWKIPLFINSEASILSEYNDELDLINRRPIAARGDIAKFPKDSLMGYGFVEIKLTDMLAKF